MGRRGDVPRAGCEAAVVTAAAGAVPTHLQLARQHRRALWQVGTRVADVQPGGQDDGSAPEAACAVSAALGAPLLDTAVNAREVATGTGGHCRPDDPLLGGVSRVARRVPRLAALGRRGG